MKIKRIFSKRKMEIGLLVGLSIFIWVTHSFAEPEIQSSDSDVDYDLRRFRGPKEKKVGEKIEIKVNVQNKGSIDPGAALTVIGQQGDMDIPITTADGRMVFAKPGGDEAEIKFTYTPRSGGTIRWQATLDDGNPDIDEAGFTTQVTAENDESKEDDEHDEHDEHDEDDEDVGTIASENIFAQHDRTSARYNKNCTACHAEILTEQSLNPSIRTAHVIMLPKTPGEKNDQKCLWCHKTVDLDQKSAGNLRRHVDVMLCSLCHGASGVEKQFYQGGLSPDNPDGPLLYDLTCAACHNDLANSKVKGESASEIQEKINKNEGGMGPLNFLSTAEIQSIANALK
jgi:nitrate/TMAO reductase-like tetraheme cytochrome c subunit